MIYNLIIDKTTPFQCMETTMMTTFGILLLSMYIPGSVSCGDCMYGFWYGELRATLTYICLIHGHSPIVYYEYTSYTLSET